MNLSKDELLDYIDELENENSDLQDAFDSIADIVASPSGDDDTADADAEDNAADDY